MSHDNDYFHFRSLHVSGNTNVVNTVTFGTGYSTYQVRSADDIVEKMCKMLRMNRIHPKENALFQFMLVPPQIKYHAYDYYLYNPTHQRKEKLHSFVVPTTQKNPLYVRRYPSSVVIFQRNPAPSFYQIVSWCFEFALLDESHHTTMTEERIRIYNEKIQRTNMQMAKYVIATKTPKD